MRDFEEQARRSVKRDFAKANFRKNGRAPKPAHPKNTKRVLSLDRRCEYCQYSKYFIGRLVRITSRVNDTQVWVEFVREGDRENLNNAAGWSKYKRLYLLYNPKFDD